MRLEHAPKVFTPVRKKVCFDLAKELGFSFDFLNMYLCFDFIIYEILEISDK